MKRIILHYLYYKEGKNNLDLLMLKYFYYLFQQHQRLKNEKIKLPDVI